ncbi:hypothetical protein D9613_008138 [Agrocybe pediades]|uniref:Uncharacterized protein n=1 Tax=Agrocybe pediades TaxID=84607 RepID=A0A8H4QMZ8_9AGAR|nr:hypothetical protein D9613_008138 [Agrocybe pediades]
MLLSQELFDMVIDKASYFRPDDRLRTRILVSLSLVSRAFRERAHYHLFASITLRQGEDADRALGRLFSLLESDPSTDTTGVASRIISFTCWIAQHNVNSAVGILKKLFIGNGKPCSLSLRFPLSAGNGWSSLPEDLEESLFQVCHRPRLASLSLHRTQRIPRNFLRNSFIKRLHLTDVSVSNTHLPESSFAGIAGQGHSDTVTLESLEGSSKNPILTLLVTASQQIDPTVIFSQLKELHLHLAGMDFNMNMDEIIRGCQGPLEILKLSLHTSLAYSDSSEIPLYRHCNLHTLEVTAVKPSTIPLSHMAKLLDRIGYPPSLHTINLCFPAALRNLPMPGDDGPFPALDSLKCQILDNIFMQKKFDRVRKLTLGIHEVPPNPLRRSCYGTPDIRSRFPQILTRKNLTFSVHIHPSTSFFDTLLY